MRLYKMELYKLIGRKFFLVSLAAGMALLFLYFWFVNVGEERSTVNGTLYTGYEGISDGPADYGRIQRGIYR